MKADGGDVAVAEIDGTVVKLELQVIERGGVPAVPCLRMTSHHREGSEGPSSPAAPSAYRRRVRAARALRAR